jgi:hypothetical protein
MSQEAYEYQFDENVPGDELEQTFLLCVLAVESLHGEARVRLDGRYCLNAKTHRCTIDAGTAVGRELNRIFAGFVAREFGPTSFRVSLTSQRRYTPEHGHHPSKQVEMPGGRRMARGEEPECEEVSA